MAEFLEILINRFGNYVLDFRRKKADKYQPESKGRIYLRPLSYRVFLLSNEGVQEANWEGRFILLRVFWSLLQIYCLAVGGLPRILRCNIHQHPLLERKRCRQNIQTD